MTPSSPPPGAFPTPGGDGASYPATPARPLPAPLPATLPATRATARPAARPARGSTWWCALDIETRPLVGAAPAAGAARLAREAARYADDGLDADAARDKAASLHASLGQVCAWGLALGPAPGLAPRTPGAAGPPDTAPASVVAAVVGENATPSEASLLADLWRVVARTEAWAAERGVQLVYVTFCGKDFDVPFLMGRSLACRVPVPAASGLFDVYPWGHRRHCDLATAFARQRSPLGMGLAEACVLAGLPSPKDDMSGADVQRAMTAGRLADVRAYVAGDASATFALAARLDAVGLGPTHIARR